MALYNENFSKYYDELLSDLDYAKRADFLCRLAKKYRNEINLVLDLACGTGSLSTELANLGKDVIAVDNSYEMLMIAREKNMETEPQILFLCQDMEELDLYGTVDVAFCTQDSFNHLKNKDSLLKAFERLKFFIEPKGLLIFDMNTPYKHKNVLGEEVFVYDCDDVYCVWQNFYTEKENAVDIELDFFEPCKDNKYERTHQSLREFSCPIKEVEQMLNKAEFTLLEVQGDYNGEPATDTDERWVFVAQRNDYKI